MRALAVALAVLLLAAAARAGEATREQLLEGIDELQSRGRLADDDLKRLRALADEFVTRFGDDDDAPGALYASGRASFELRDFDRAIETLRALGAKRPEAGRLLLGLALAERGRNEEARAELKRVALGGAPGAPQRMQAAYAMAQICTREGDPDGARECLGSIVEEARDPGMKKRAAADLEDLAKVGAPAPPLAEIESATGTAAVVVFQKRGDASAAPAAEELVAAGARVVRVEVDGWDDPRVKAWHVPALPRVYVVDRLGIVRAAGVRGKAIAAAVARE